MDKASTAAHKSNQDGSSNSLDSFLVVWTIASKFCPEYYSKGR